MYGHMRASQTEHQFPQLAQITCTIYMLSARKSTHIAMTHLWPISSYLVDTGPAKIYPIHHCPAPQRPLAAGLPRNHLGILLNISAYVGKRHFHYMLPRLPAGQTVKMAKITGIYSIMSSYPILHGLLTRWKRVFSGRGCRQQCVKAETGMHFVIAPQNRSIGCRAYRPSTFGHCNV